MAESVARVARYISIHSPRMGRDPPEGYFVAFSGGFQSTLPAWGETIIDSLRDDVISISIHSPRMGRDPNRGLYGPILAQHFNPLSPHGERPAASAAVHQRLRISIHSPRMGRDERRGCSSRPDALFQSTLPAWGETLDELIFARLEAFQSTLPAWGETCSWPPAGCGEVFQSTLPAWGETRRIDRDGGPQNFNPLSPHGERRGIQCSTTFDGYFNPLSPHGERR